MSDIVTVHTETEMPKSYSRSILVTREMAREWLTKYRFPHQRALRQQKVEDYAGEMLAGLWLDNVGEIVFGEHGDVLWLLNGQHRLRAVEESGVSVWMTVTYRQVSDIQEARDIYAVVEPPTTRTNREIVKAFGVADHTGLADKGIDYALQAIALIMVGFESRYAELTKRYNRSLGMSRKRAEMLVEWDSAALAYLHAAGSSSRRIVRAMHRQAVMSVGMVTFRYRPEEAPDFWSRIARNSGLQEDTAEHTLLNFLSNTDTWSHRPHIYARYVAAAWNAYVERRPLKLLKLTEQTIKNPIRIAKTPYDGSKVISYLPEVRKEVESDAS